MKYAILKKENLVIAAKNLQLNDNNKIFVLNKNLLIYFRFTITTITKQFKTALQNEIF